jgi:energy-coupling factor transport system ATP-binding protein
MGAARKCILGQNGAGKTTIVKMMNNLLSPTEGEVLIGGNNTKDFTTAQVSQDVGYVFQNPADQIFHATVNEEVAYGPKVALGLSDDEVLTRTEMGIKSVGLWGERNKNPFDLPLSVRKFVAIASIVAMDPSVYIFDEPTAGQDLTGLSCLARVIDSLHVKGKTVVTITHDIEFAVKNFDRIIVMCQGVILKDGNAIEVFYDDEVMDKARLKPPYVTRLARDLGMRFDVVRMDSFLDAYVELVGNVSR